MDQGGARTRERAAPARPCPSRPARPGPSFLLLSALAVSSGCPHPDDGASQADAAAPEGGAAPEQTRDDTRRPARLREGSSIALSPDGASLFVADEDHGKLRRLALPLTEASAASEFALPGPPAKVLAQGGRVLVTVRDPGLLLVVEAGEGGALSEVARVSLPADAWGLALTPDEGTALVTSAYSQKVSAVDLASMKKLWSVDVEREPRGIVVRHDGKAAYVTHLVGSALTRVELGAEPRVSRIALPPAPARQPLAGPRASREAASLGYAVALSPDGARLFAPRHALGGVGRDFWFGAPTVDVLVTHDDTPLAPPRAERALLLRGAGRWPLSPEALAEWESAHLPYGDLPTDPYGSSFVQPTAIAYRARAKTLLVASEASDAIVELDALSLEPALSSLRLYRIGEGYDVFKHPASKRGGAPSGIALSADEALAYVYCRSTNDVAALRLEEHAPPSGASDAGAPPDASAEAAEKKRPFFRHLEDDVLPEEIALGRRLFYSGQDRMMGSLACSGCHPDGRDDGHTWHMVADWHLVSNGATPPGDQKEKMARVPRQTPMLAGRVAADGPYGWQAESPTLGARIAHGFDLHGGYGDPGMQQKRAHHLMLFLKKGLVPPPREKRAVTAEEARGRALFESREVGCTTCHAPETSYTDRALYRIQLPEPAPGFDVEKMLEFRTPSLLFVGGTPPYFHDGSAPTLEALIEKNRGMGKTHHLSAEDRAALVAFLRTL